MKYLLNKGWRTGVFLSLTLICSVYILLLISEHGRVASHIAIKRLEEKFKHASGKEQIDAAIDLEKEIVEDPSIIPLYHNKLLQWQIASHKKVEIPNAVNQLKSDLHPYYFVFSQATSLIIDKKYEEALVKSLSLREQMNSYKDNEFYGINLLRIASLQEILQPNIANPYWKDVQSFIQKCPELSWHKLVKIGEFDLEAYIHGKLLG